MHNAADRHHHPGHLLPFLLHGIPALLRISRFMQQEVMRRNPLPYAINLLPRSYQLFLHFIRQVHPLTFNRHIALLHSPANHSCVGKLQTIPARIPYTGVRTDRSSFRFPFLRFQGIPIRRNLHRILQALSSRFRHLLPPSHINRRRIIIPRRNKNTILHRLIPKLLRRRLFGISIQLTAGKILQYPHCSSLLRFALYPLLTIYRIKTAKLKSNKPPLPLPVHFPQTLFLVISLQN